MNPLIIGIAGGSGCGKSTFAKSLEKALINYKTKRIKMDDYYYYGHLPQMTSPVTQCLDADWNHPDSIDFKKPLNLIKTLKEERSNDVIIVEGAFLYCYDEMLPFFDLKVFIDLDADTRMYRRIKRNTNNFKGQEGESNVDFQFEYYLNFAKFQEQKYSLPSKIYADIILNGNKLDGAALDVLVAWIQANANI